jgi:hypothetical protein
MSAPLTKDFLASEQPILSTFASIGQNLIPLLDSPLFSRNLSQRVSSAGNLLESF